MASKKRSGGGGVDWMPIRDPAGDTASLGAGSQVTIVDSEIENKNTGAAYSSGALVGLRCWCSVTPGAAITRPPRVVCLIVPAGMTVPTVITEANLKANEKFVWWQKQFAAGDTSWLPSATVVLTMEVEIRSARRFDSGDRLVLVLINDSGVAFAAGAVEYPLIDVYVRED